MGPIRCLAIFSSVLIVVIIILSTQLTGKRNKKTFGVVIALAVICLCTLSALLYKLLEKRRRLLKVLVDEEKGGSAKGGGSLAASGGIELAVEGEEDEEDDFLRALSGVPAKLNLKELEIATGGFCNLLGQGGFGSVYEGELPDGTKVAVKRLETESKLRSKEFCAEVVTISGIHHVNLVRLLGYCSEGSHRLLVYEYMENGSLDRWLFQPKQRQKESEGKEMDMKVKEEDSLEKMKEKERLMEMEMEKEKEKLLVQQKLSENGGREEITHGELPVDSSPLVAHATGTPRLSWAVRFRIALETARALAYLHEECHETILHLDVKPQNILLDTSFHAKVSDFGLSRAIDRTQSRLLTSMRGTPGYLAPKWLVHAGVTARSDVYSYGMVLLELVSGRRNVDHSQNSDAWYFPTLAFQRAQEARIDDIVDPTLRDYMAIVDQEQARLAIRVAFWCIQDRVAARPTMSCVVRMLEGSLPVVDPPLSGVFSFTNVLVLGGVPYFHQTEQEQQKPHHSEEHNVVHEHNHPTLETEEPLSISIDSSTPDSPLPPPPCR